MTTLFFKYKAINIKSIDKWENGKGVFNTYALQKVNYSFVFIIIHIP